MSQRPLFDFLLRPLDEVAPFGGPQGEHLHWFGLTDGWYWLNVGADTELFRYSRAIVKHDAGIRRKKPDLFYVDYQVVRLWEDLLDMLPDILEPVPGRLARMLGPDGEWDAWETRLWNTHEESHTNHNERYWAEFDLIEQATSWRNARRLDVAYLQSGPDISLWSDEAEVHVQWDNRDIMLDGIPAWEAIVGTYAMPRAAFLAQLTAFDARLIGEMGKRVAEAQRGWSRPHIALDIDDLVREHADRSQWLARRLAAGTSRMPTMWLSRHTADIHPAPTDWNAVYAAIAQVEAMGGTA